MQGGMNSLSSQASQGMNTGNSQLSSSSNGNGGDTGGQASQPGTPGSQSNMLDTVHVTAKAPPEMTFNETIQLTAPEPPGLMNPNGVEEVSIPQTPWMDVARGELGEKEIRGRILNNEQIVDYLQTTGDWWRYDETAWCAAFCNWTLSQVGIEGTNSARALSWENWGLTLNRPALGSIAIINWGGGKGHVGFVVGQNANGDIILLGGNQGDMVKYSAFSQNQIDIYVHPHGYNPNYNLPILNLTGNTSFEQTR